MYAGDSFYTLGLWAQVGLICVSVLFGLLALAFTRLITLRRPLVLCVPIWIVAYITFLWGSPQGYYEYYRLIIDGLPAQSLIGPPPRPEEVLAFLTFSHRSTLAAHSAGLLGWAMFVVAIWPQRRKCRDAAN
ncbi:MAG: hypothetical protein AAFQ19_09330 [Pseudomonadota bacterium]